MSAKGYETVGDIVTTHSLQYHLETDGNSLVMDMLANHTSIAPVVDDLGHLAGFVGESDILDALQKGRDLGRLKAGDFMKEDHTSVIHEMAPISEVVNLFQNEELQIIPIIRDNQVIKSVTRHDLIRAMTGAGLGVEQQ
jgi:CBS domain-containing protein